MTYAVSRKPLPAAVLAAIACLAGAAPACAQEIGYFTGLYETVGRDGSRPPQMMHRFVRLEPDGEALRVLACGADEGRLTRFGGELPNIMSGTIAGLDVFCSHYNNSDNYAHFACWGETGELLSLWATMEPAETPLAC